MNKLEEKKGSPLIEVTFVVLGNSIIDKFNPNMKLKGAVQKVLAETGNTGQPFSNWQLRTEDGRLLDMEKTFSDENVKNGDKLFLSLKTGKGGILLPF